MQNPSQDGFEPSNMPLPHMDLFNQQNVFSPNFIPHQQPLPPNLSAPPYNQNPHTSGLNINALEHNMIGNYEQPAN